MSASLVRRIAFLMLSTAWPLVAQVSEEEVPVDLGRGLALKADTAKPDAPLAEAKQTQVGAKDFSLAMTVPMPEPLRETVLAAQIDDLQGWRLLVTADGALRLEARVKGKADPFAVATTPGSVAAGSTHHVAVNILRDAAKPNTGIWLDGIELASGIVPPADLTASQPLSVANGAQKIHLYQRSLSRPEMLALWLDAAGTGKPVAKHPAPPADGPRFVPQPDETIALIGGTEAVALAESGELEAMLLMSFPETRFHFRNLAWEGDTVFRQDRPMNFGDLEQQLQRVNAGTVFVMFGRQECLDRGKEGLQDFKKAFEDLIDAVSRQTDRIVIVNPPAIEKKEKPLPDLSARNETLGDYSAALNEVARTRNLPFVGGEFPGLHLVQQSEKAEENGFFQSGVLHLTMPDPPFTSDGVTLTPSGVQKVVRTMFLDFVQWRIKSGNLESGSFDREALNWQDFGDAHRRSPIRAAIQTKNRLWHSYWRPSNWAFLHGDRTQQPSSRDPVNPQLRFFPAEQEKYLPLIKEAEEKVYKLVEEATKKLP